MDIFAIGIEHPLDMTVQRLHTPIRAIIVGPPVSRYPPVVASVSITPILPRWCAAAQSLLRRPTRKGKLCSYTCKVNDAK